MRNGFIAVVWLLLVGLGVAAWLSTQDYDLSQVLRFARTEAPVQPVPADTADNETAAAPARTDSGNGVSPTFDIVRVEPDGTAVIAGRAGADADVTVLVNGDPVGNAKADELGEWAVVVDKPLPAGSHSLTVSSVAGDGSALASDQSVAIAVPARKDEKPLIVLSEKGEPSKIIQAPSSVPVLAQPGEPTEATAPQIAAASPPEQDAGAAGQPQVTAPATPGTQPQSEPSAVAALESGPVEPSPSAVPSTPATPSADEKSGRLALKTVDYDDKGNMVFQGTGKPGGVMRIYIDNQPVADAAADENGTWTLHVLKDIEPGNHKLRVDQLGEGAKVASRIELPFTRARPEDVIAAMAGSPAAAAPSSEQKVAAAPSTTNARAATVTNNAAAGSGEPTATAPSATPATASQPPSEPQSTDVPAAVPPQAPAAAEPAPAASVPAIASSDVVVPAPPVSLPLTAPAVAPPPAAGTTDVASTAESDREPPSTAAEPASSGTAPDQAAQVASAVPHSPAPPAAAAGIAQTPPSPMPAETVAGSAPPPSPPSAATTVAEAPPPPPPPPAATTAVEEPSAPPIQSGAATVAETPAPPQAATSIASVAPTVTAPESPSASPTAAAPEVAGTRSAAASPQPLPASGTAAAPAAKVVQRSGRVIIQPGNNLWNISRVIYGEGLSYTTIYEANAEQIRDPDLIYPGQIFRTPGVNPPEEIAPDRREPLADFRENG